MGPIEIKGRGLIVSGGIGVEPDGCGPNLIAKIV